MRKKARIAAVAVALFAAGCAADSIPVRAVEGYARLVNPEYLAYVEADGALSDAQKQRRRDQVASLDMAIAAAQGGGNDE